MKMAKFVRLETISLGIWSPAKMNMNLFFALYCDFTSISTVFQSYQDNRQAILKGYVQ